MRQMQTLAHGPKTDIWQVPVDVTVFVPSG